MSNVANYLSAVPSGSLVHARVPSSTSAVTILSSSVGRVTANIFNHSAASLYLKFEGAPTINDFDVKLSSGSYYELPKPVYLGQVNGIWDAANGFAMIADFSGVDRY